MYGIRELEQSALAAFRDGIGWNEFWQQHGNEVRKAEPWSRGRYRRLVDRLLHLLTTGEPGGQEPPSIAEPWEVDDAQPPAFISDTATAARCLWPAQSTQKVPR
jgi:hypothetical protein